VGGETRNRLAALEASTGNLTSWNPNASGTVNALVVSGSTVYAGGSFTAAGGPVRGRLATLSGSFSYTEASVSWVTVG
jgi:hypothetical protein